jgi:hypothetical protein
MFIFDHQLAQTKQKKITELAQNNNNNNATIQLELLKPINIIRERNWNTLITR